MILFYSYLEIIEEKSTANMINFILGYITFGTFLGFVDDVIDLRWRHKLIYPFFYSLLLILNY